MATDSHGLRWRVGLVDARAAAFLMEIVPIQLLGALTAGPVIARAIHHYDPWTRERGEFIGAMTALAVHGAVDLCWFLARDAVPGLSWGKRLMGLQVLRAGSTQAAPFARRLARNFLLAIPFFVVIEGIVALLDASTARRIGDRIAGTQVRFCNDPAGDHGLAILPLTLGLALYGGCLAIQPWMTEWCFNQFY